MKIKLLPFLLLIIELASAQGELTLPYMEHVYQSSYLNPSAIPDHKVSIGLPGISSVYAGVVNTGFVFSDGLKKVNDSTLYDIDQVIDKMSANNFLYLGTKVDLFHLRIKAANSFISFDVSTNTDAYFSYTKDFFQLATLNTFDQQGNARSFELSGMGVNVSHYNQYAIGYTKIIKNLAIGGRFKLLQGLSDISTYTENLKVNVDNQMYDYSFSNQVTVNTSGPIDTSFNIDSDNITKTYFNNFKNLGFAADLGISYTVAKKWHFSLALNNLGFINWKNNTTQRTIAADTVFRGADVLGGLIRGEDLGEINILDSLVEKVKPKIKSGTSYSTTLVPRIYLTAKYDITPKLMVAATLMLENYKTIRPTVVLGAQFKIARFLSLTGSGSFNYGKMGFGGGIVIKPGPLQIYIVGDNLFTSYYSNAGYAPLDVKFYNIRAGINLVFGRLYQPKKQAFNY